MPNDFRDDEIRAEDERKGKNHRAGKHLFARHILKVHSVDKRAQHTDGAINQNGLKLIVDRGFRC